MCNNRLPPTLDASLVGKGMRADEVDVRHWSLPEVRLAAEPARHMSWLAPCSGIKEACNRLISLWVPLGLTKQPSACKAIGCACTPDPSLPGCSCSTTLWCLYADGLVAGGRQVPCCHPRGVHPVPCRRITAIPKPAALGRLGQSHHQTAF